MRTLLLTLTLLASALPLSAQARRAMTTDDGLDMVQVGGALISPDGSWVLYSKSELDWEENERKTTWWRVPAAGGEAYRFIGEEGGSGFQFSPDGSLLAFTREVEEGGDELDQLFLMRTDGGEAWQLTEHGTSVGSFQWSGDGAKIYFLAVHERSDDEEERREDGYDAYYVDEGPNGQAEGRWNDLWVVDVESEEETRVTEGDHRIGSFSIAPDGTRAAFTLRTEGRRNQSYLGEIYVLDLPDGEPRRVTENRAPEGRLLWAPDSRRFAYTAQSTEDWELREDRIYLMDAAGGEPRALTEGFEGSIGDFEWTPDGRTIVFGARQGTNQNLYRLDVASGRIRQVTEAEGSLSPRSFSRDRSVMAYTFEDFDTPPDVWVSRTDGTGAVRLTHANPTIEQEIALGEGQVIRWRSSDGLEIEGVLMLPAGHDGGRLPLLLHVHGGPAGAFTNQFSARDHVWAGLGYAQLFPNVRGSSGYGDDLLRGNMRDLGGGDYQDLMTGVDHLIERGVADQDRLAIRGWSYGGILGGWTITQTDRFKAASLGAMVSDWTSEYGPGFNHDVRLWYIGGTPWENPEEYRFRSALTHVANVTTPTLLLHGNNDTTDTEQQSMMFFQALKDQGKTTRYIRFPREPHGFREPRHQRTRDIEEILWIQKYALGIDWTPWERPDQDADPKVVSPPQG